MSLVDLDPSLSAPGVHNVLRMLEAVLPIDSSARSTDQRTKLSVRPEGCGGVEADVVLHVPLRGRQTCGSVRNEALWFSDDPSVPWPYRGRKLTLPAIQAHPLQPRADESVLMWRNREALWTVSGSDKQTVFRTAFPLPSLCSNWTNFPVTVFTALILSEPFFWANVGRLKMQIPTSRNSANFNFIFFIC